MKLAIDNFRADGSPRDMGMYRITLAKMLVLLRLVIIASLAGYSLPAASAAMHGSIATSTTTQSDDHHEMTNGEHVHGGESASPDDMQKNAKQECCKDFCVSFAIVAAAGVVGVRASSFRKTPYPAMAARSAVASFQRVSVVMGVLRRRRECLCQTNAVWYRSIPRRVTVDAGQAR